MTSKMLMDMVQVALENQELRNHKVVVAVEKIVYDDHTTLYVLEDGENRQVFSSFDEVVKQQGTYRVYAFEPYCVRGNSMYDRWREYWMVDGKVTCNVCGRKMKRYRGDWYCRRCQSRASKAPSLNGTYNHNGRQ